MTTPTTPHAIVTITITDATQAKVDQAVAEMMAEKMNSYQMTPVPMVLRLNGIKEPISLVAIPLDPSHPCTDEGPGTFDALDGRFNPVDDKPFWVTPRLSRVEVIGRSEPMHIDWVRSLRDQCKAAGEDENGEPLVEFVLESWGDWLPISEIPNTDEFYRSIVKAKPHEDQGKLDEIYGRRCIVPTGVVRFDGRHGVEPTCDPFLWSVTQGKPSYMIFRVGPERSGRMLDGVEHRGREADR